MCHSLNVEPKFKSIKPKLRRFVSEPIKMINGEVDHLLEAGFIEELQFAEWISNVVVVEKKQAAKWRVSVDFINLNKVCLKDDYVMVDTAAGYELLSLLDAFFGHNQVSLNSVDCVKTGFITDRGLFCLKVMPFGLKNVGATYQRLVNIMLQSLLSKTMEVYIDDMVVKSKDIVNHVDNLTQVFAIFRKYNMKNLTHQNVLLECLQDNF